MRLVPWQGRVRLVPWQGSPCWQGRVRILVPWQGRVRLIRNQKPWQGWQGRVRLLRNQEPWQGVGLIWKEGWYFMSKLSLPYPPLLHATYVRF